MVYTKAHWERHCAYKHTSQPCRINHHLPLIKINVAAFPAYKTQKVQAESMKLDRNTLPAHLSSRSNTGRALAELKSSPLPNKHLHYTVFADC